MPDIIRVGGLAWWLADFRQADQPLRIRVKVVKARENYGRTDFLITPIAGDGELWVQETKLEA